jgi:hypothetical protein
MRALFCIWLGCVSIPLAGCGPSSPSAPSYGAAEQSPVQSRGYGSSGTDHRQRQADFLNRIRKSDPQFQTIEKAVLNENNDLGLVLNREVQVDSIPKLMKPLLASMANEFPGQDLTIAVYAPTEPPMRMGTAHLDARTRDMTYTPATPQRRF